MLEGAGPANDEILVLVPERAEGLRPSQLEEETEVVVSGKPRTLSLSEIERELTWDFDPELEAAFRGVTEYVVADRVEKRPE